MEWLLPLLLAAKETNDKGKIKEKLMLPSTTFKKLVYQARKFGLIALNEGTIELTDRGKEYISSFQVLSWEGRRLRVKGPDGCFLILIRKSWIKSLRVPCT